MKIHIVTLPGLLFVAATMVTSACADDDPKQGECLYVYKPEECSKPVGSDDEVGDGDDLDEVGDGDAEKGPSCTTEPDNIQRTVLQCNGRLTATIQFKTLLGDCAKLLGSAKFCQESHEFGVGFDSYEMPAVMACCGAEGVPEDDVLVHCAADLVDQVCRSIPMRIQKLIDGKWLDGKKIAKDQAVALRNWVGENRMKCRMALLHHADEPGTLEPRAFRVPNSPKWALLNDFTITLNEAVVESATLPEDPADYQPCDDAYFNNTELFESKLPVFVGRDVGAPLLLGRGMTVSLSDVDDAVSITSTLLVNGEPVAGAGTVTLACQQPRCSSLVVTEHAGPGLLALEELELFADGPVSIAHGPLPVNLDGAALRLYGASPAEYLRVDGAQHRRMYAVAPHDAQFVISGAVAHRKDVRWATNTTPIFIFVSDAEVEIFGFTVAHTDGVDQSWIVHVPGTTWK